MKNLTQLAVAAGIVLVNIPVVAFAAEPATSSGVSVHAGQMLYDGSGHRVATIYRVNSDGNPQLVLNGTLVTVPASTLSETGGKIMTSLSKSDIGQTQ